MSQTRNNKISGLRLTKISEVDLDIYINLARVYEAEFSNLTEKMPNEKGIFEPDTMPVFPYEGYLLYKYNIPVGFCVIDIKKDVNDIAEFYIIPSMRRNKLGYALAITVFNIYPGRWQVRQIEGAEAAKNFWRKIISKYTQNQFQEDIIEDPNWGMVTRQQFMAINHGNNPYITTHNGLPLYGIFPTISIKLDISQQSVIKNEITI